MSKYSFNLFFISFISLFSFSQSDVMKAPFSILGPSDAMIYTDLKAALKDKETVYKLNLNDQVIDTAKLFKKIGNFKNLQVMSMANNGIHKLPEDFGKMNSLIYFSSKGN